MAIDPQRFNSHRADPGQITEPAFDTSASAGRFWSNVDQRIHDVLRTWSAAQLGVPRQRTLSINVGLPDATVSLPTNGWVTSVHVMQNVRISGWQIMCLVAGSVQVDLRVSQVQDDPNVPPPETSLPGSGQYLTLNNGYSTGTFDLSNWVARDMLAGSILSVYVLSKSGIAQATLGIQLVDLISKVLQP